MAIEDELPQPKSNEEAPREVDKLQDDDEFCLMNLAQQFMSLSLVSLMSSCVDFSEEVTELQAKANWVGIKCLLTPQFHCELGRILTSFPV
jgi:hypothetical protein